MFFQCKNQVEQKSKEGYQHPHSQVAYPFFLRLTIKHITTMASRSIWGLVPVLAIGFCTGTALAQTTPEYRGLWVNGWASLYNTAPECTTVIDRTRAGNLNSVAVQMRRRGDAFYNS